MSVAIAKGIIATIVMFGTTGPLTRGRAHVGDERDAGKRAAHRPHVVAAVKVGAIVAASVLLALAIAFAFL